MDETLVPLMLEEYGSIIRKRLREYLSTRSPRTYLDSLLADYPRRAGKMLGRACASRRHVPSAPAQRTPWRRRCRSSCCTTRC